MKLNLGCGDHPLEGYVNVDLHSDSADVKGDIRELTFEGVEEVVMSHVLEHMPWKETCDVLERVHSWMIDGGVLSVEVPDMQAVFERGVFDMDAQIATYGIQSAPGEIHMAGFTDVMLADAINQSGFTTQEVRRFVSQHPARRNFPCIEAVALA